MIQLKRIYDPPSELDGFRILVERLWPRGISKERAHIDLWLKEVAPSAELRKWFSHDPARWEEFQERYRKELEVNPAVEQLLHLLRKEAAVTFIFAAHDVQRNSATLLKGFIERGA